MGFPLKRTGAGVGAVLLFALLGGCGQSKPADDCGGLTATNAWAAPVHPGASEMLGYMALHNGGSQAVVINGASSSQFRDVVMQNQASPGGGSAAGSAKSEKIAPITVPPGGALNFAPNKRVIALFSPVQAYRAGDQVEITLACGRDHGTLNVPAVVSAGNQQINLSGEDQDTKRTEQALKNHENRAVQVSGSDDSKTAH